MVITKSDFFFGGGGSFLYILRLFKVKIQNGNIFLDRKISNSYGVCLIFFFFFFLGGGGGVGGLNSRCWVQACV